MTPRMWNLTMITVTSDQNKYDFLFNLHSSTKGVCRHSKVINLVRKSDSEIWDYESCLDWKSFQAYKYDQKRYINFTSQCFYFNLLQKLNSSSTSARHSESSHTTLVCHGQKWSATENLIHFCFFLAPCEPDMFFCHSNMCINNSLVCNGIQNCVYPWDENHCKGESYLLFL